MSSAFAIAAVTAVLKDLLNDGMANHDLSAAGHVTVTALPPDRIPTDKNDERSQINVFFYQVTPNGGWRNAGLPSRDGEGARLTNPPLALDLHYLITAYGAQEFHAEALLGYAMQLFHETPLLTRQMINRTLKPALPAGVNLPPNLQMVSTSDLAEQVELIKICPQTLTTEEISKLWAATQARYRPTAAYQISVVLIQETKPVRSTLPVLTRGPQDQGPIAQADLIPPFPTLERIELPRHQISAQMGNQVTLTGHDLAGESGDPAQVTVSVVLVTNRLLQPIRIDVPVQQRTDQSLTFTIPHQAGVFYPAGFYRVSVAVMPNGRPNEKRTSNELALLVAPRIVGINGTNLPAPANPPINMTRTNPNAQNGLGEATLTVSCSPDVLPEQSVSLIVGDHETAANPHAAQTGTLTFAIKAIAAGIYRLRLRVDGVDTLLIDRSDERRPTFDESQKIELT